MKKMINLIFAGALFSAPSTYGSLAEQLTQAEIDSENAFMTVVNFVGLPDEILVLRYTRHK
ncbi:MAG: hypothetical protein GY915_06360 [bacterium]|nr:hypothetical protein [bacterium]